MIYIAHYKSPIGNILLAAKNQKLIGLWIENQKYYLSGLKEEMKEKENYEILIETKKWLDRYFKGERPRIEELELEPIGSDFRKRVWKILTQIPYGTTVTYQEIAKQIAKELEQEKMSAQAVGNAIGHNPISIIIPCHRVVASSGSLTGYAGGLKKKIYLLQQEEVDMTKLWIPMKEGCYK